MDVVKKAYTWYKCDCAPNLTDITPHVVILAYKEDPGNSFFEIRGNINMIWMLSYMVGVWGILLITWIK